MKQPNRFPRRVNGRFVGRTAPPQRHRENWIYVSGVDQFNEPVLDAVCKLVPLPLWSKPPHVEKRRLARMEPFMQALTVEMAGMMADMRASAEALRVGLGVETSHESSARPLKLRFPPNWGRNAKKRSALPEITEIKAP